MIDFFIRILDGIIQSADKLGALGVASVWAFFTIILIGYVIWDMKIKKEAAESAWQARLKEAEADGLMANAIEKLANEIKELRYRMDKNGGANV